MRESLVGAALAVVTGEAGQRLMGVAADAPTPIHTLLAAPHNRLRSGCSGPREGWAVGPSPWGVDSFTCSGDRSLEGRSGLSVVITVRG